MQQAVEGVQAIANQQHITLDIHPTDAKAWIGHWSLGIDYSLRLGFAKARLYIASHNPFTPPIPYPLSPIPYPLSLLRALTHLFVANYFVTKL